MSNTTNSLTSKEWNEISDKLSDYHSIFYRFWTVCTPVYSDRIPTAAVAFDPRGECIEFLINKKFWETKTLTQRVFIISHECRHLILNHGRRGIRIMKKDSNSSQRVNVAMDLCINEEMVSRFGFIRAEIDPDNRYVWADKIEAELGEKIPTNRCFEFYYNLMTKLSDDSFESSGDTAPAVGETVDDHSGFGNSSDADVTDKVMESLVNELDDSERESLDNMMRDEKNSMHRDEVTENMDKSHIPGTNALGQQFKIKAEKVKAKKKWETVIKKWSSKFLKEAEITAEQWARTANRYRLLPRALSLPTEMDLNLRTLEKNKIDVWFFLDTSGSCIKLASRFFKAASSLPKNKFNVKLFCFDTKVYETDLKSKKVKGGGGTAFNIIESYIVKNSTKYPDAIFVITDGFGNTVRPKKPAVWHWFLTNGYNNFVPPQSKVYNLKDYE